jgi:hypothetical protein
MWFSNERYEISISYLYFIYKKTFFHNKIIPTFAETILKTFKMTEAVKKIRIIIVDDHTLFRIGLKAAFQTIHSNIEVVGEAGCGTKCGRPQ